MVTFRDCREAFILRQFSIAHPDWMCYTCVNYVEEVRL